MNASELSQLMLNWESLRRELDKIEATIAKEVLERGKTFVVGNVRATLNKGRTTYDYEAAVKQAGVSMEVLVEYTTPKVDYRALCLDHKLEVPVAKQDPPSVKIKLEE